MDLEQIARYRAQSKRYLDWAVEEAHQRRWDRVEDMLWGSLGAAVKAVALSRGVTLEGSGAVVRYARRLAKETRDRRLARVIQQVLEPASLRDPFETLGSLDCLYFIDEEVRTALERLWDWSDGSSGRRDRELADG